MRAHRVVACLAVLSLSACPAARRGHEPQRLPDDVFAPAAWESGWTRDETDSWREGTVVEMPADGNLRAESLPPIADALVELLVPAPTGGAMPGAPVASARSGPDGSFRVGPAPPVAWILRASRPGYATGWIGAGLQAAALGAAEPLPGLRGRIALRKACEVHGRVTDDHDRPVAGAHVAAAAIAYREDLTTGADGTFTAHTPRGPVIFNVEGARWSGKPVSVTAAIDAPPPEAVLRVREETPLRGRVLTTPDRAPAAGAIVVCLEDPSIRTRADDDGRFELAVARGRHVAAVADGYGWRSLEVPKAGDMELRVGAVPPVTGFVVDAGGHPVANARLTAVVVDIAGMYERVLGPLTGPDGGFTMSWLPRPPRGVDATPRLVAVRRDLGETAIAEVTDAARATPLRLAMGGVRELRGKAATASGKPIGHALVTAKWGHWDGTATPAEVGVLGLAESATTLTDADGNWRIRGVPVGLHAKVECEWRGFVKEWMLEGPVAAKTLDFEFAGGGTIAGHVVAAGGGPVEGPLHVTAQLVNAAGSTGQCTVDAAADGTFRFDDLPPGSYQIRVEGERYDLVSGGVFDTGKTDVSITMERSAKLTVRFDFDGGRPPDVPLLVTMTPESKRSQVFNFRLAAGRGGEPVVLTKVDPGVWKLTATGDVWRAELGRIELGDGEPKEIAVRVTRTLRVAAKVFDAKGDPVPRQLVVVTPAEPGAGVPQPAVTGADGVADVTGLEPGRWIARVEHEGDVPFETAFNVQAGENPAVELRAPRGGSIEVHVARGDGDPLADATVALSSPEASAVHAWGSGTQGLSSRFRTDATGRVTIRGVREGRVIVSVSDESRVLKKAAVDIRPGETETMTMTIEGR